MSDKGFPGIRIRAKKDADGNINEELNKTISQYLVNWQCPTERYNGLMGIEGRIPSWIYKIDSDDCCPKFSEKQIELINNKITTEKIIPILSFAPEEFYQETKQVWWIVPLSIWAGDKASWLFIDKNGVYAAHPGDEDIAMIFPWDRLDNIEYLDEDFDTDESEIHSLNLKFDGNELTFVEFVSPGQGSYLSVINSIYQIREETIKASSGAASWLEGVGGEGFKSFDHPSDLLTDKNWEEPNRPNPAFFGYNLIDDNPTAEEYFNLGKEKLENKDYQGAIDNFTKVIELKPKDDAAYQRRGTAKNKLQDYRSAIEDFTQAISLDSNWWGYYFERGNAKNSLEDYQGAIEDYSKVIELNPDHTATYQNRGNSKSKLKDYQSAIEDFTKAIKLNDEWWGYYFNRGNAKNNLEDYQGAIEDYSKVIELNSNHTTTYQNRGKAKSKLKDYQSAIEDFTNAIKLNDGFWGYYYNRGNAKKSLEDYKGAIDDFTKVIELNPTYKWAYESRANSKKSLEDYKGAIDDFTKVIELKPDAWAYMDRAAVKSRLKNYSGAIEDYTRAIELAPNFMMAYADRAYARVYIKDYHTAIEDFTKAISLDSHPGVYLWQRGKAKNCIGDYQGAIEDLTKALENDIGSEDEINTELELAKQGLINIGNKEPDGATSGSSQQNNTENSIKKSGNVILYNDFDTWIAEIRNGQEADSAQNIKERKPLEISKEAESIVRRFFDELNLKCSEDDLLSFKFSPTGGCTVYFKNRKVAGLTILKKNIIELMILRDYNKKYFRPVIDTLNISNIREEQISYKVPWGYAFYIILNEPQLINENFDTLFSLIQEGITTIKFDRILSLKSNEFKKLKPIFEGTFSITPKEPEITKNLIIMKKCKFVYKPTFIYLHLCDTLQDIENQNFKYYAESDANSSGTIEYEILEDERSIFKYTIPVNHPEEEDLNLDELEGKILVREINVYSEQKINALIEEGASLQPISVYYGLAYSFDGVDFGNDEMEEDELQEYEPLDNETEERYFEYFLIKNGKPELLEI